MLNASLKRWHVRNPITKNNRMRRIKTELMKAARTVENHGGPYRKEQVEVIRMQMSQQEVFQRYVVDAGENRNEDLYYAALDAAKYVDCTISINDLLPDYDVPEDSEEQELYSDSGSGTISREAYIALLRRVERLERLMGIRSDKNRLTRKPVSEAIANDLISQAEALKLIGCGKTTIKRWADEGLIQAYHEKTHVFYSLSELMNSEIVKEHKQKKKDYGRNH